MEINVPYFLKEMLQKQYGEELTEKIIEGYDKTKKTTLRVNTIKTNADNIENILKVNGIEYEKVQWSKDAFIIKNVKEKDIQSLQIYQNGEIYLQSLSSMLPPIILNPEEGTDILDMSAAPGGKTTQMAAIVNNKASITACEINKIRAERLKYNVKKQGATCVYTMVTDARRLDSFFSFDKILLDAPCSGSGTIDSKNSKLEKIFTQGLIKKSIGLQSDLLKKAMSILKVGSEMVYSTCSILKEENEEIIEKAIKTGKVEIVPIEFKGMEDLPLLPTKIKGCLCVCPNELYEGFFIAKLKRIV